MCSSSGIKQKDYFENRNWIFTMTFVIRITPPPNNSFEFSPPLLIRLHLVVIHLVSS